ncbi:MAG: NAD(P)-dependent alcohol dehydrogenase [Candidatus Nanopelagicaceae bacterium]
MRAVVFRKYGAPDVLHVEEIERPIPKENEVLIKIHATTVNRTDCGLRGAEIFITRLFTGLLRPKQHILGMEFSGEVVATGAAVTEFKVGDDLFGITGFGSHAEFIALDEGAALAKKPAGMAFDEAAAVCDGAILALAGLWHADLRKGRSILVYGASGSIGTAAVQLSRYFDADVTAVCNSKNLELIRSLGADQVIDYTQEDFTNNGKKYDVIFDAVGKHSFRRCRRSLNSGGIYMETDPGFLWHVPLLILLTRWIGNKKVMMVLPKYTKANVLFIKGLIEAGKYRAVIDRSYPLEDVVAATRYVETEEKTGNVVLTLEGGRVP